MSSCVFRNRDPPEIGRPNRTIRPEVVWLLRCSQEAFGTLAELPGSKWLELTLLTVIAVSLTEKVRGWTWSKPHPELGVTRPKVDVHRKNSVRFEVCETRMPWYVGLIFRCDSAMFVAYPISPKPLESFRLKHRVKGLRSRIQSPGQISGVLK